MTFELYLKKAVIFIKRKKERKNLNKTQRNKGKDEHRFLDRNSTRQKKMKKHLQSTESKNK